MYICISSIGNWGYEDNFKPVFFKKKNSHAQKAPKRKSNDFHPSKVFMRAKNRCLCCFFFAFFCLVSWFLLVSAFLGLKFLCKKINRFKIALVTSINYTTDVHPPKPAHQASSRICFYLKPFVRISFLMRTLFLSVKISFSS